YRGGVCVCVFFFEAEDGIRYWSVTGVQTCALPIWPQRRPASRLPLALGPLRRGPVPGGEGGPGRRRRGGLAGRQAPRGPARRLRSEERRVGKGGRTRGGRDQEKKRSKGASGERRSR